MRRRSLAVLTCLCLLGCDDDDPVGSPEPRILAQQITAAELPVRLDESRTYFSYVPVDHPEALLRQMWQEGLRPTRAWQPVRYDSVCLAVLPGAQFTVELEFDDPRILDDTFARGTKALTCATGWVRYVIVP